MKVTNSTANGAAMQTDVMATETAARVTPGDGPTFGEVMRGSAQSLLRGAAVAVQALPMSPVVAASVRPSGAGAGSAAGVGGRVPGAEVGLGVSAEGGSMANVGVAANGAAPGAGSVEAALEHSQEMNLYFLQLQEQLASENRAYTAYSNVLKARHETVKNAIGNIR